MSQPRYTAGPDQLLSTPPLSAKAFDTEDLEHAFRLATLGTIAAGIAHEINNILTPMIAYAQLAQSHPEDQELQQKAVRKTVEGGASAAGILEAMLSFSSRNSDSYPFSSISKVAEQAIDCLGRREQHAGIGIECNIHPDACVSMKPLALQQVLVNLILNARNALCKQGGTIHISTAASASSHIDLIVRDNGPGIDPELLDHVFDFFVSRGEDEQQKSGRGFGLAICEKLVADAGGSISVRSKPGEGAEFIVRLPRATAADSCENPSAVD